MMHIGPLIYLIGNMLVLSLWIHGSEVRDPCKFMLDPPFAPLFNDFRMETDKNPCKFGMLAHPRKKIGCNP